MGSTIHEIRICILHVCQQEQKGIPNSKMTSCLGNGKIVASHAVSVFVAWFCIIGLYSIIMRYLWKTLTALVGWGHKCEIQGWSFVSHVCYVHWAMKLELEVRMFYSLTESLHIFLLQSITVNLKCDRGQEIVRKVSVSCTFIRANINTPGAIQMQQTLNV